MPPPGWRPRRIPRPLSRVGPERPFERLQRLHGEAVRGVHAHRGFGRVPRERRDGRVITGCVRARFFPPRIHSRVAFASANGVGEPPPRRFGSARNAPSLDFVQLDLLALLHEQLVAPEQEPLGEVGEAERPPAPDAKPRAHGERLHRPIAVARVFLYHAQLFGDDLLRVALVHRVHSHLGVVPLDSLDAHQVVPSADAPHPLRRVVVREEPTLARAPPAARHVFAQHVHPMHERHRGVRRPRAFQEGGRDNIDMLVVLELDGHLHAALRGGGRPQVADGGHRVRLSRSALARLLAPARAHWYEPHPKKFVNNFPKTVEAFVPMPVGLSWRFGSTPVTWW